MQARYHARNTAPAILALAILTTLTGCAALPPTTQPQAQTGETDRSGLGAINGRGSLEELRDAEMAREHAEMRAREAEVAMARARALAGLAREHAEARSREAEAALSRAMALESQLVNFNGAPERSRPKAPGRGMEEMAQNAQGMDMQQTSRGMVLTLGDVLFDSGRADLKPGAARTINRLSEFMAAHPRHTVLVEGHTDNTGDPVFNRRLSLQRAEAVRDALMLRGISPHRVAVRGLASDYPVASNATSLGRQKNRRVEIIISDDTGRIPERF
ncbi:Outer membrane protein OmpA [Ectothiorhodospira magna]|uniref:Outer membrane protein OmpA n=1 Tax=Ectothiorhodospira magna TaxID=867345 RepID=A0A1H9AJI3_9GAMM|nr:OmpA family protein [Ectothiorhodospira magna]SEP76916.1 Outer membrane protein OmpA [Ectothiorhodospira magna]